MTTPPTTTAFACLHGDEWTDYVPVAAAVPATRQRAAGHKGRTNGRGSWPAHGLMLDDLVYVLPPPPTQTPARSEAGAGARFSTPDTRPEAPNATSNRRARPSGLGNQTRALMPTPHATLANSGPDYARATRPGSGGDDLTTVIARTALLPTPTARDHKGGNQRGDRSCLTGALLPTPRASDSTKGSPHQHGSSGDLTLPSAVHLLPTPTAGDARSSAVATVQNSGRRIPAGCYTLTDAARLLPTPTVADALGGHRCRSGSRASELLLPGIAQAFATTDPTSLGPRQSSTDQRQIPR